MYATNNDKYHDFYYKIGATSNISFQYEININGKLKIGKHKFGTKIILIKIPDFIS